MVHGNQTRTLVIILAILLVTAAMAGCAASPAPAVDVESTVNAAVDAAVDDAVGEAVAAALTALPTPTNLPTAVPTDTPAPTATMTPTPAPTFTPTATTPPTDTPTPPPTATKTPKPTRTATSTKTPTPTPTNTPIFILLDGDVATPWASPTPTADVEPIPDVLVGKIAFVSNRSGGPEPIQYRWRENPTVYLVDPDGGNLAVLTDYAPYETAMARDAFSADQRYRVFVKDSRVYDSKTQHIPTLYTSDGYYGTEERLTYFGHGAAWDPVISPDGERIAFVANDSGDDEIWIINRDGSGAKQLTVSNEAYNAREIGKDTFIPEITGQPSWSPDGRKLVYWSNAGGKRKIWVLDVDSGETYSLSTTIHDDWNPVWIKYTDPAK